MDMYKQLAALALATEATPLVLGGVEFWIDADGPWAGELAFSKPTSQWNGQAMGQDVAQWAKVEPAVVRIVAQFA